MSEITGSIAWEATTTVYKRFITDKQYRLFSKTAQRWYKPYQCSQCAARPSSHELAEALRPFTDCVVMSDGPRLIIGFETDDIAIKAAHGLSAALASIAED